MKNLLFLLCMIALSWSCSSSSEGEPEPEPVPGQPKEYIVSLGMAGEILDIDESPLTKAIGKDLYGINVYSKVENGQYTNYAYGIFSDKSLMKLKLLEGYLYKIEVRMIGNVVKYQGGDENNPYFEEHFYLERGWSTKETNKFVYTSDDYIYNVPRILNSGMFEDEVCNKSYYGCVENYKPIENGNIQINMKVGYFGAKFIAEGLTEGFLQINFKDHYSMQLGPNKNEVEDMINFTSFSEISNNDNYSETFYISVKWVKADGAIVPLINKDITFKRNVLTTITIKVKDTSTNNNIDITQESGEMTQGDNITIESGTGLDGNVDPVEN